MKERYGNISVRTDEHTALIEIDRPPHNHVNVDLIRDLADALDDIDAANHLRVSVLSAAGKNFCAGADLVATSGGLGAPGQSVGALYEQAVRIFSAKKPIVAAVQGAAVGAGLGLALAADFRVVTPDVRLVANFVMLGFHPGFGITYTLPRLIGAQRATLMCLTGRRVKSEEALAWGLADQIASREGLADAASLLAFEVAQNAPLAIQATRATLRAGLADAVRAQTAHEMKEQERLRQTADFAEGVRAVQERRVGNFTGT